MMQFCKLCGLNSFKAHVKTMQKRHVQALAAKLKEKLLISCKRKEFDFYYGQKYNKLDDIKLASKGWHHKKSKGDYFILHINDEINVFDKSTFANLGLSDKLIGAVTNTGIFEPTLVQSEAIPIILSGKSTLITMETGCGKTLAYLLPVLDQIITHKNVEKRTEFNAPLSLILAPSRELAYQIGEITTELTQSLDVSHKVIVGGGTKKKMLNPSFEEVDLLIATPGAMSKLVTSGVYKVKDVAHVVLDEADTLLDDSFSEKMGYFLKKFNFHYSRTTTTDSGTQLTLVSATMPTVLPETLSETIEPNALERVTSDRLHRVLAHVPQRFLRLGKSAKPVQLLQMVKTDAAKRHNIMIFSNKTPTCDWISMFLNENGVKCVNLNGDIPLKLRKEKYLEFSRGDCHVISCTDVGSRGLDTTKVKHVINYDFPMFTADYIHRCGRTGRIGSPENCHITNFISVTSEVDLVQKIEMAIRKMENVPNVNGNITRVISNRIIHRNNRKVNK